MRVLVTGARGKVGRAAAVELLRRGHDVVATDLGTPVYERDLPGEPFYVQADLTDAGSADALVRGVDAVVHAAAMPDPIHHVPHEVFANNVLSGFNVVEACVRAGVPRLVNISSETVPGFIFAEVELLPTVLPLDEQTPCAPHDPYGFGKHVIEQWCDGAAVRAGLATISIRPSWVLHEGNYARNLGPVLRDPTEPSLNFWAYTDNDDLAVAIALAAESDMPGHEVVYVAQPDNSANRPLAELVAAAFPDAGIEVRDLPRPDASGIDSSKAQALLGWEPTRSWRDHLDADGRPLATGGTSPQRPQ